MALTAGLNTLFKITGRQKIQRNSITRIVCVKLDEIGDMVSAVNVFAELKLAFPNAKIDVLCKPFVKSLIEFDPNVDRILLNSNDLGKYDVWVELRGNWNTLFKSIWSTGCFRADRGTVRFKQRGNQAHESVTNYRVIESIIRHFCEKTGPQELPLMPKLFAHNSHKDLAAKRLIELGLTGNFVVIHPAARKSLRQWPPHRFSQITEYLWNEHRLYSVVVGTKDESNILKEIEGNKSYVKTLISEDSLLVLHEMIRNSVFFIGNESGPLQIANVTGKPVIGLFGPGVKNVFYPNQNSASVVLHRVLDCNPCDQINCVKSEPCINLISTAEVILAIESVLSTK